MTAARQLKADEQSPAQELEWNKNILVVDDEVEITHIYRDILAPSEKVGIQSSRSKVVAIPAAADRFYFNITVAHSAREALIAAERMREKGQTFAMGFFDVRLGDGMDGIELFQQMQKIFPQMYSVFVTAYNDRTIDSITSTLGPTRVDHWDYMNKPFTSAEITQKARNFVSLWNLKRSEEQHAEELSDLHRKILESERVTSVAAVARGVAHEFGNLLMQIMGKAEVSRNKSEEQMRYALDIIVEASQRAHEILDRFNHLSDNKSFVHPGRLLN
jgi:DNA-binding NtrC family response regulator